MGRLTAQVSEDRNNDEYWGPMTYIRIRGIGEHVQDENGLLLWLNGIYDKKVLDTICKAFTQEDTSCQQT